MAMGSVPDSLRGITEWIEVVDISRRQLHDAACEALLTRSFALGSWLQVVIERESLLLFFQMCRLVVDASVQ